MKKLLFFIAVYLFVNQIYSQTIPAYYNDLDLTKTHNELFLELSTRIISTHSAIPYTSNSTDVWDACKLADEDPDISANVLLIYGFDDNDGFADTDRTRNKDLQDGGGGTGVWNREHVFAKSLANPSFGTGEPGPGTDVHNLRAADRDRNSLRSARKFTDGSGNSGIVSANGGWYPGNEWKGDVARIVMYMYLRYNGDGSKVAETNCLPINVGFGDPLSIDSNMIDLFLKWNVEDPVSAFEADRNEALFSIQKNRNPFIDNPYLATLIWNGLVAEDKWNMNSSTDSEVPSIPVNLVASNITDESFDVNWDESTDNIGVYDYLVYLNGVYLQSTNSTSTSITNLISDITYEVRIKSRDASSNYSAFSSTLSATTLIGPKILFSEDFEDCNNLNFFTFNEASNKNWECNDGMFGENNSGSYGINGYEEDVYSKDWLITKNAINFDNDTGEKISFYTDAAYGTSPLDLVYSSEYDGTSNPSNFTWLSVPNVSTLIHNNSSTEKVYTFKDIDISTIEGSVYFAFKYYSNGEPTRWTVESFEITADNDNNPDSDGDGVLNELDLCPNTPVGEDADSDGCSNGQLDDDNDGVQNSDDLCENTPEGEDVDSNGCSESQLDDDNDGVMNNIDLCDNTPEGEDADSDGCSNGQLDDDNDGVQNSDDLCENTPEGEDVDSDGCSESQLDDDGDGVMNNIDECLNTQEGVAVDEKGCKIFSLSSDNFAIEVVSETCPNKDNGQIKIETKESYDYVTTINGIVYNFTDDLTVEELEPGVYDFCITVTGKDYEQCYTIEVLEGNTVSGKSSIANNKVAVEMVHGTAPFNIFINDKKIFTTSASEFSVAVKHGDVLEVKTAVSCEGVYAKTINLLDGIVVYPNPTKGNLEISLPVSRKEVVIALYNSTGQLVSKKSYSVVYGKVQLDLTNSPSGLYIAKLALDKPVSLKIIKQ